MITALSAIAALIAKTVLLVAAIREAWLRGITKRWWCLMAMAAIFSIDAGTKAIQRDLDKLSEQVAAMQPEKLTTDNQ